MKVPPVKGTRDFYPEQMRIRNFIIDGWKAVSVRNGFEEYDGPIFEYLKMFQLKSGDEIAEQLFSLTDRGGRELAIRPEITPTLARMVNQQINSLSKPIKWFSVPRLCRAERPQKGRLREFFQWNVDIIGIDDPLADAETIFCAVDYLQQVGLTANDIVIKISSRRMLAEILKVIGIAQKQYDSVYAVLDKRSKMPDDAFEEILKECIGEAAKREQVLKVMSAKSLDEIGSIVEGDGELAAAIDEVKRLFAMLDVMGVSEFCEFDIGIVRGLAYYTGVVYEIYDKASELRAIGGGGRYDNLLKDFGGPSIAATGFGMGDCVLGILLEEKGLLRRGVLEGRIDCFVAYADAQYEKKAIEIATGLRRKGVSSNFSYKGGNLGKQLKQASAQNAARCIIIGQEIEAGQVVVKDMAKGEQKVVGVEEFFKSL